MTIYIFTKSFLPTIGGVENSIFYLAKQFQKFNLSVEVVSFDGNIDFEKSVIDQINVTRFFFKKSKLPNLSYNRLKNKAKEVAAKLILEEDQNVIITRNSSIALGLLKSNFSIIHIFPTISKLNVNGLYKGNKPHIRLLKQIDYWGLREIEKRVITHPKSKLVTFSKLMKDQISSEYSLSKKIHIIYPGVDYEKFRHHNFLSAELKAEFSVVKSDFIVFVGRLAKAKNIDILVDSLNYIGEKINLLIVGDGPEKNNILKQIKNKNLQNRVFLLGTQDKYLPELYSRAKATILPTIIETFGQVLIESLACGTPVVAFGNNRNFLTATNEIVKDKNNGVVVDEYSVVKLAEGIDEVIGKEDSVDYNVRYCKQKFNWNNCCRLLIELHNVK